MAAPTEVRFWAKVAKRSDDECWLWTGARTKATGYGRFMVDGSNCLAHRYSYELHIAPIPVGEQIDHLCRVKLCVNPLHLEPVTPSVNMLRAAAARPPKNTPEELREYKRRWAARDRAAHPEKYRAANRRHYAKLMMTEEGRRKLADKALAQYRRAKGER